MFRKRDSLHRFFIGGRHFKEEFRRQVRMIIIITLGFTVAFTWRQTVFDLVQSGVKKFFSTESSAYLSVITSTTITIISLLLIYIASQLLKNKPEQY